MGAGDTNIQFITASNHFASGLALELRRAELFEEARVWVGGREEKGRIKYSINVSFVFVHFNLLFGFRSVRENLP